MIKSASLILSLLIAGCGPSRTASRLAPPVLEQYGFQKIVLNEDTWLDGCPRGFNGITGTAERAGQPYKVAVCWRGSPPQQQIALITEKLNLVPAK